MNQTDATYASDKMEQLKSQYLVEILSDWKDDAGTWQPGTWLKEELDALQNTLNCFAECIGGAEPFKKYIGEVKVRKADIGTHGGEALAHRISFAIRGFSPWTTVHEFAHTWDANHGWGLSKALEDYTSGSTSRVRSLITKIFGKPDSGIWAPEKTAGRYGRLPGCNAAGYFYGDKPSGSNWSFNRVEDFAESVAMYVGWERGNDLSKHAKDRVVRYQLKNGERDGFGVEDNWEDYATYFYPENGDYTKTKRWKFVDDLVHGRITVQ